MKKKKKQPLPNFILSEWHWRPVHLLTNLRELRCKNRYTCVCHFLMVGIITTIKSHHSTWASNHYLPFRYLCDNPQHQYSTIKQVIFLFKSFPCCFFFLSPHGNSLALIIVHTSSFVCISYSPKVILKYMCILPVTIFPSEFPRAFRNRTAPAIFWNGPFPCSPISPGVIAFSSFTYISLLLIRKSLPFDSHIYCKYSFVV